MRRIWRNRWTRWIAFGGLLLVLHVASYPVSMRVLMGSDTWRYEYDHQAWIDAGAPCRGNGPSWDPPKPAIWVCYRPLEWCIRRTYLSKPVFMIAKLLDVDGALQLEIWQWKSDEIVALLKSGRREEAEKLQNQQIAELQELFRNQE